MMKFFTSVVTSCKDIAGKLRNISAKANGIDAENRQLMQQFGFISVPTSGSKVLFLEFGNVVVAVASDGPDRPKLKEGESALYRKADHYLLLKENGTVEIKAPKGVDIDGDLRVNGNIWDKTGSLDHLRQTVNSQTHGTAVGPTSPGTPPDTPNPAPPVV